MTAWDRLTDYEPASLDDVDRRASLQRRVDHKYVIGPARLGAVLEGLREDHDALEIDGHRSFEYRSVYFDTPDLKCFRDHIEGRKPRYKIRTRHYVTTRGCVFEVKLKRADGETAKHSIDYSGADEDRPTRAAWKLIQDSLGEAGEELPRELRPTLVTAFERSTLAFRKGGERVTVDRALRLSCGEGESLAMKPGYALFETKTEDGTGRCDRLLADAGIRPVSFSKYRLGVGRLTARDADPEYAKPLMEFFAYEPTSEDEPAARVFDSQRSAEMGQSMSPPPARVLEQ